MLLLLAIGYPRHETKSLFWISIERNLHFLGKNVNLQLTVELFTDNQRVLCGGLHRNPELVFLLAKVQEDLIQISLQNDKKRSRVKDLFSLVNLTHTSNPNLDSRISFHLGVDWPVPQKIGTTYFVFPKISGTQAWHCERPRSWRNFGNTFHWPSLSFFQTAQTIWWPLPGSCHHRGTALKGSF